MRILHTADWHLGKRLNSYNRLPEQKEVLAEICSVADKEQADIVLIAGDLFDTYNPSTEAAELFYRTLKKLSNNGKRPVIAIAGNHDSPDLIEAPVPLAKECGIFLAGYPGSKFDEYELDSGVKAVKSEPGYLELSLPQYDYSVRMLLTPYANEARMRNFLGEDDKEEELRSLLKKNWQKTADRYMDGQGVNLLVSHLFFMKKGGKTPEEPDDEKPIHIGGAQAIFTENIPDQIQYTALGHLHRYQQISGASGPVVYSSSPLSYSFSEAGQNKYVVLIDAVPSKEVKCSRIPLQEGRKLVRQRCTSVDEAADWLSENQNTLVELTVASENFLSGADRKRLMQVHDGIVALIPEITNPELLETEKSNIDLSQEIEPLFKQYFRYVHGKDPDEDILNIFKEIRAENL